MRYLIEMLLGWLIGKRNGWTPDTRLHRKRYAVTIDGRQTDWAGLIHKVDEFVEDER